ncbi:MAG: hypothetical protein ACLVH2_04120 [Streptococcus sp.]
MLQAWTRSVGGNSIWLSQSGSPSWRSNCGVNNRNLTTFEVDLQTSVDLAQYFKDDCFTFLNLYFYRSRCETRHPTLTEFW